MPGETITDENVVLICGLVLLAFAVLVIEGVWTLRIVRRLRRDQDSH